MKGFKKAFSLLTVSLVIGSSLMACGIFGPSQEETSTSGELSEEEELVLEEAIDERIHDKDPNEGNVDQPPQDDPDKVESKWGPDSATAIRKYSLYYQYYKQNNYQDAYDPWRWMIFNAPKQSVNLYIRGVELVEFKMGSAAESDKEAYIDTLMMVYDKRIKHFNKKGYVLGRKGMNLLQLDEGQSRRALDILKKSIELKGNNSESYVPKYLVEAAVNLKENEKISKDKLLKVRDKAMKVVEANIGNGSGGGWSDVKSSINSSMDPYISCSDLISKYKGQYEENKNNLEKLKTYQTKLDDSDCTKDPFYLKVTEQVFKKEPSANIALKLARNWKEKNNNDKAIEFYKKAIEQQEDDKKSADHALSIANIYKDQKENLIKARKYAKKAINLNPKKGKAYLFLGELYIAGSDRCGEEFDQNAVYWVAVDKFQKAKEVDVSVEEAAQKRIRSYSQRFPKKQPIFFRNLKEGDPYKVECWINEKTTVRKRPE